MAAEGWKQIDGDWYNFGGSDVRVGSESDFEDVGTGGITDTVDTMYVMLEDTFIRDEDSKFYYLKDNGVMAKSAWIRMENDDTDHEYHAYAKSSGEIANNAIEAVSNRNYAFTGPNVIDAGTLAPLTVNGQASRGLLIDTDDDEYEFACKFDDKGSKSVRIMVVPVSVSGQAIDSISEAEDLLDDLVDDYNGNPDNRVVTMYRLGTSTTR